MFIDNKFEMERQCLKVQYIWGRNGFDGIVAPGIAGRGFSLASLKSEEL